MRILRSSLFGVSSRKIEHVIYIPSMRWINPLILCGRNPPPSTYYCIIKGLRSGTGHAQAGSYHLRPADGGDSKNQQRRNWEKFEAVTTHRCIIPCEHQVVLGEHRPNVISTNIWSNISFQWCVGSFGGRTEQGQQVGGWVGGGSVSADVASLDIELAQECFANDCWSK